MTAINLRGIFPELRVIIPLHFCWLHFRVTRAAQTARIVLPFLHSSGAHGVDVYFTEHDETTFFFRATEAELEHPCKSELLHFRSPFASC